MQSSSIIDETTCIQFYYDIQKFIHMSKYIQYVSDNVECTTYITSYRSLYFNMYHATDRNIPNQ